MNAIRQVAQLAGSMLFIVALLSSGTAEAGVCPPGYYSGAIFHDTACYPNVGVDPVTSPLITCTGRCEICAEYAADERRGCVQCGLSVACLAGHYKPAAPDAPATTTSGTLKGTPPPLPYHPIHKLKITPSGQ
jgi:hypothetical protein